MFITLLATIDLLCAAALALVEFGHPFPHLQAAFALLLGMKALLFIRSGLSVLDLVVAVMMLVLLWTSIPFLPIIMALYLAIKGLYSMA